MVPCRRGLGPWGRAVLFAGKGAEVARNLPTLAPSTGRMTRVTVCRLHTGPKTRQSEDPETAEWATKIAVLLCSTCPMSVQQSVIAGLSTYSTQKHSGTKRQEKREGTIQAQR